jgi:hypothetical protein
MLSNAEIGILPELAKGNTLHLPNATIAKKSPMRGVACKLRAVLIRISL